MALRATKGRARPDPVVLLLCRVWDRQSAVPPKCFRTSAFQRSWELGFLFPVTPLLPKATSFQKSAERGYGSAAETEALPGLPAHRAAGQGTRPLSLLAFEPLQQTTEPRRAFSDGVANTPIMMLLRS